LIIRKRAEMPPSISVVIPAYNYGRFIGAAIDSVLNQTYPAAEILVIDNGSTDNTKEVVAAFGDAVRYFYEDNLGVSVARNLGVDRSTGDLIAFLDADDYWEPTCLERAVAKFEQGEDIGLVHWGLREFDSSTGETIRFYLEGSEENVAENLLVWEGPTIAGHGAVIVTRDAFFDAGGFDTETEPSEDWDFCYRLTRQHKIAFVPEPLVNYRAHPTSAHRDIQKFERGMGRFFEKAFSTDDKSILELRRKAYGNFHSVMAGSYFHAGEYGRSLSHALRSVMMRPGKVSYFLTFPLRRFRARR
jgi:glycosyltransferase involved in cell wall biosynthesis